VRATKPVDRLTTPPPVAEAPPNPPAERKRTSKNSASRKWMDVRVGGMPVPEWGVCTGLALEEG
jgi:hypothetical protein